MKPKKIKTINKKEQKKIKDKNKIFKQKYFDYYDDVKHYTNGKEDW